MTAAAAPTAPSATNPAVARARPPHRGRPEERRERREDEPDPDQERLLVPGPERADRERGEPLRARGDDRVPDGDDREDPGPENAASSSAAPSAAAPARTPTIAPAASRRWRDPSSTRGSATPIGASVTTRRTTTVAERRPLGSGDLSHLGGSDAPSSDRARARARPAAHDPPRAGSRGSGDREGHDTERLLRRRRVEPRDRAVVLGQGRLSRDDRTRRVDDRGVRRRHRRAAGGNGERVRARRSPRLVLRAAPPVDLPLPAPGSAGRERRVRARGGRSGSVRGHRERASPLGSLRAVLGPRRRAPAPCWSSSGRPGCPRSSASSPSSPSSRPTGCRCS